MKLVTTIVAMIGLLITVNATAMAPAGLPPRALGDGTVNVARDIDAIDTNDVSFTDDINPNTALTGPIAGQVIACFGCFNFLNECKSECGGDDRGTCEGYCDCAGLQRKDCKNKECKPKSHSSCPGKKRSMFRHNIASDTEFDLVDETSHYSVGKRALIVPIEHLDDPSIKHIVHNNDKRAPVLPIEYLDDYVVQNTPDSDGDSDGESVADHH